MNRRSWLFVPGNQERKLEKAFSLPADLLIIDWEDAVPPAEKERARERTAAWLSSTRRPDVYIRINGATTPFFAEDAACAVQSGVTGVMLPKAEDPGRLERLDEALSKGERRLGIPDRSLQTVPLIESAKGLVLAKEIAASPRVKALAFGTVDFTLDIGARLTDEGDEILYARSQLVLLSRVAGIEPPIDGVRLDVKDDEGLKRECQRARTMGFQGKLAVHPQQVPVINACFSPSATEVETARKIVQAYEDGRHRGAGAVKVEERMVDAPVVEWARRILNRVEP